MPKCVIRFSAATLRNSSVACCGKARARNVGPEERLTAKEGRFRQTAPMIARLLFPLAPALLPDCPQVLIPLPGGTRAVAMLPDLGVSPRRNHALGPARFQGVITLPLVIRPIRTDLRISPGTWSTKSGSAPSSVTPASLATAATISPVASSTARWSLRHVRRLLQPCWRTFHSPSP